MYNTVNFQGSSNKIVGNINITTPYISGWAYKKRVVRMRIIHYIIFNIISTYKLNIIHSLSKQIIRTININLSLQRTHLEHLLYQIFMDSKQLLHAN